MEHIANGLMLLANLGILGLNLKLYTEWMKDKSMDRRAAKAAEKE